MHYLTDPNSIVNEFSRIPDLKIAVIGDIIVDEYIFGEVDRISPEAPVPIVKLNHKEVLPGGAANVALNLKKAGAGIFLFGVVGEDSYGSHLKAILRKHGVDVNGIVSTGERETTVKSRVIAQNQQIVRLDKEKNAPIPGRIEKILQEKLIRSSSSFDAVVIQDYEKGVMTRGMIDFTTRTFQDKFIAVDPKYRSFFEYKGVNLFKPNLNEVKRILPVSNDGDNLLEVCDYLMSKVNPGNLVVTLGKEGMLLGVNGDCYLIPAMQIEVYDVTGAGDTALSFLVIGFLLGLDPVDTCILANIAAGLAVQKLGTVQIELDELQNAIVRNWETVASGVKKLR